MLIGFFYFLVFKEILEDFQKFTEDATELPSNSDDDSVTKVLGVFELDFEILSFL